MNRSERQRIKIFADGVKGRAQQGIPDRFRPRKPNLPFPYGPPPTPQSVKARPSADGRNADFETDWARRPSSRVVRAGVLEAVIRPTISVLARPTREGLDRLENLDTDNPVIFVANHDSHIDTTLILTSLPDPWRYKVVVTAAADYFFGNKVSGAAAALVLNAIPMERKRTTRTSANKAAELIEDGWSLLIYPEGGRSKDGWGQPFKAGAAYLAQRTDVPVVPIHIEGTNQILRKGRTLPKAASTTVNFGDALTSGENESSRSFAARIEAAVEMLADETRTDWWQARQRAHDEESPSLRGPDVGAWRRQWALGDSSRSTQRRTRRWPYVR